MRVLQVNKFLYRRAGAEAYFLDLARMLAEYGQEVGMWGTDAERQNFQFPISNFQKNSKFQIPNSKIEVVEPLVAYLNFDQREGLLCDLKKFGHMVWSREAARKFEQVVCDFKPDIAHIHNIYHHISPSILSVAARLKVPVVMTVHDWHLINPNYTLYDHGEICERHGLRAIMHRCIQNSFAASLADVLEWRLHKMLRVYEKNVARFLVPNEFVRRKLVEGGIQTAKIEVVPLPVGYSETESPSRRRISLPYILFAGRLIEEKGIYLLVEIAKQMPEIQFKIAGTGPKMVNAELRIKNEELKNVELLGFVKKERLPGLIAGARLVVVPSLWYDLSPLSVLEAMAAGKVVVASRIGGIPELIQEEKTGFLIPTKYESPANIRIKRTNSYIRTDSYFVEPWVDTIRKIYYDDQLLRRFGRAAQEYVQRAHNPEKHYERIMEIYNRAISH